MINQRLFQFLIIFCHFNHQIIYFFHKICSEFFVLFDQSFVLPAQHFELIQFLLFSVNHYFLSFFAKVEYEVNAPIITDLQFVELFESGFIQRLRIIDQVFYLFRPLYTPADCPFIGFTGVDIH